MRPVGTAEELERRRNRAIELVKSGVSLNEAARRIGCHASSVMRWRDTFRRGGKRALAPKPVPGRPSRLTKAQQARLLRHLLAGAMAHGYRTDLWTTLRIAEVVRAKFGVRYHRDHVGRLLHSLDWSCQKPDRRAMQRDEEAIAQWKDRAWPRIKKLPRGWAPISSS
jgi:transposase